jgi:hypothetical protein
MTYSEAVEQATRIAMARSHVAFIHTDPSAQFNFRFDMPMELSWPDEIGYKTVARIDVDGSLKLISWVKPIREQL